MTDKRIKIIKDNIINLVVDAIVNAANTTLLGGGGVDGAIHQAAGPNLLEACKKLNGCKIGEAKITPGFNLPAKYIIHTVGPIWKDGKHHEEELLANCYRNSLNLALQHKLKTIAFPAISTGAYGFPKLQAAQITINEVNNFLRDHSSLEEVIFVCFNDEMKTIYEQVIKNLNKV